MISTRWLEKRKPNWSRLEDLLARSKGRGVSALDHKDLQELGLLYRQTASDLAIAREDITSSQLAAYLNSLLGRAHNLIYMGNKPKVAGIVRFYSETYPRIFRELWPQTLLAFAIFAVTGLAAFILTMRDPTFAHRLLGTHMMETIEKREMWTHSIVTIKPLAASSIMTNNLSVAFATFASGITGGVGTVWMMVLNGLLIGVIGAATLQAGMAGQLWTFVVPHGVLELPAIFIAGGAGFEIARGMLFPGLLPRRESLARAGGRAAQLLLGTIPMLIVAGVIEGFLSPSETAAPLKFLFGAVMFAALVTYLMRAPQGRKPEDSLVSLDSPD
jgi:uncharacterized membrane protein SpoIIM required for sporulation